MLLVKSPLRVSLVGGGTDFPDYFKNKGGAVISASIDKFVYVAVNKRSEKEIRISYSKTEIVTELERIEHDLIREALKKYLIKSNLEIVTIADLPSRGTGLGSSSALCVSILAALNVLKNGHFDSGKIASEACEIEINILGKPIGMQDQYASAIGGFNRINFSTDGQVTVKSLKLEKDNLTHISSWFKLLPVSVRKNSTSSLLQTIQTIKNQDKNGIMDKTLYLVDELEFGLKSFSIPVISDAINEGWNLKKQFGESISNSYIDDLVALLKKGGMLAAKIVGAGSGGYLLIFAEPEWFSMRCPNDLSGKMIDLKLGVPGTSLVYSD
jgi:D-glycero-alpha-D-manno-heptose-7-phosphate kinase